MVSGTIASGTQQLHYLRWDGGKKLLLAFHGYGNNAALFKVMAGMLTDEYTVVSIDLPYHGKSDWHTDEPWQKEELVVTVKALMKQLDADRISIVCFSIGGRVGLTLAEQLPEVIASLVLIAADGLVPNRFYHFVTANAVGKKLFGHFLENPAAYMKFINWLAKRKWIHLSRKKFVDYYTAAPESRNFLRKVWPNMRRIIPDLDKVKRHIEQYHIDTHLFMGRYDRVIPVKHAEVFAAGQKNIHVHILEKSHRIMDEQTAREVAKILSVS